MEGRRRGKDRDILPKEHRALLSRLPGLHFLLPCVEHLYCFGRRCTPAKCTMRTRVKEGLVCRVERAVKLVSLTYAALQYPKC